MAYATTNPPMAVFTGLRNDGGGTYTHWVYHSTDVNTDVDATGYFTNGDALGMTVGDTMTVIDTDTSTTRTEHSVIAVTAGGAASISGAI